MVLTSAMNTAPVTEDKPSDVRSERATEPGAPGALHGEVGLTLQTHQALILVHGRAPLPNKPAIIGLIGFADRLRIIWEAARHDDPYADWWLIKVDEAIQSANDFIEAQQSTVSSLLDQLLSMDVAIASSDHPTRLRLQFANPYAYQAARSLARFDQLVCAVVTATHIGLLSRDHRQPIQRSSARKLRSLFVLPQAYRVMKLDRAMVRARQGRTHEACQTMGDLPEDILSGERRPRFAPPNPSLTTATNQPMNALLPLPATHVPDDQNNVDG